MKRKELLAERLKEYAGADWYPFHMPGHKRMAAGDVQESLKNTFRMDITEIEGFDNLHHPMGILKESMEWAASVYGSDKTYYLVNGSSGGILSGISAVARNGEGILVARNCHKSVYHGVVLNRLNIHYIYPQIIPEMGIQGGISVECVEKSLSEHPDIRAAVVVSPTYDGVVSDVRGIAEVVHKYGVPLIVDEAHGAHFSFGKMENGKSVFPESALSCGADLVIQSLHKTLPSMTQTAVLHLRGSLVDRGRLERYLQIYQSSSPSYVLMAGGEACIYEMEQRGKERMEAFAGKLAKLRKRLLGMRHLMLLDEKTIENNLWYALDPSRIVISCRNCVLVSRDGKGAVEQIVSGEVLLRRLREDYHLELEMCGADYVVAITTVMDTEEGMERLADGLLELDGKMVMERTDVPGVIEAGFPAAGKTCMPVAEALDAPALGLPVEKTTGHISGEFVYLYPPGIPVLVPGEKVTEDIVERIVRYRELGLPVQGMEDKNSRILKVVREQ